MAHKYVTISVMRLTKERLIARGRKNEVFDQLVNRVLDAYDEVQNGGLKK
jgi:hypothetical protein